MVTMGLRYYDKRLAEKKGIEQLGKDRMARRRVSLFVRALVVLLHPVRAIAIRVFDDCLSFSPAVQTSVSRCTRVERGRTHWIAITLTPLRYLVAASSSFVLSCSLCVAFNFCAIPLRALTV